MNLPTERSTAASLIEEAFRRLASREGFVERADQVQLAMLLGDLIGEGSTGCFEAPTGLGKSLATLIPAIAHALATGKRTVIATYTNVLAEQYWRKDLPLALSLFDQAPRCQFLIGRQRYACLVAMDEHAPDAIDAFMAAAELGIETEFRTRLPRPARELTQLWSKISAPPVCAGRFCPAYNACFYYSARRGAQAAEIIITNHSVVIQDALAANADDESEGLLGKFDFLILDEAHDFPQAAVNGLEFELSAPRMNAVLGVANRLETALAGAAAAMGESGPWASLCADFRERIEQGQRELVAYSVSLGKPGILTAAPEDVWQHPQVQGNRTGDDDREARQLAFGVGEACDFFLSGIEDRLARWREDAPERMKGVADSVRNYQFFLKQFAHGSSALFDPHGVAVTYSGQVGANALLRQDVIDLAPPLTEMIWNRQPWACLSATLAVDNEFDYFRRVTGAQPDFSEILPSPFDFHHQAAVYMPPPGRIPDPTVARREGSEEWYWRSLAAELSEIIRLLEGRTLALFHSRREMDGVLSFMDLPPELPILTQTRGGVATVGERFRKNVNASLFALRSFWTGFDAPGETLSCVALVRVPFEVPVDPPQIARLAYLQSQGLDAFQSHTLPQAKMMMRQGAGRLIRRDGDRGIIALLDPRLRTKRYGEDILSNLPSEMRIFNDFADAVGWVGIEVGQ